MGLRDVGGGVKLLDVGATLKKGESGSISQLLQLSKLAKAQQTEEKKLANQQLAAEQKRLNIIDEGFEAARGGDFVRAQRSAEALGGPGSYFRQSKDTEKPGAWEYYDASRDQLTEVDIWFKERNNPKEINKQQALKAASDRFVERMDAQEKRSLDASLERFGVAVSNPSSRRLLGRYQMNIDAADGLTALLRTNGISIPENIEQATPEERESLIKEWDGMPKQFVAEVVKALDRMVTQGASTMHGQEVLMPDSYVISAKNLINKIQNAPGGVGAGKFLLKFAESAQRERSLNLQKRQQAMSRTAAGFGHLFASPYSRPLAEALMRSFAGEIDPGQSEAPDIDNPQTNVVDRSATSPANSSVDFRQKQEDLLKEQERRDRQTDFETEFNDILLQNLFNLDRGDFQEE